MYFQCSALDTSDTIQYDTIRDDTTERRLFAACFVIIHRLRLKLFTTKKRVLRVYNCCRKCQAAVRARARLCVQLNLICNYYTNENLVAVLNLYSVAKYKHTRVRAYVYVYVCISFH